MARKKGKLPRTRDTKSLVMRFIDVQQPRRAVAATETPVQRYDEGMNTVVNEVLLMDGVEFRGGRDQIPIVDSHDDSTVRNIFGSFRAMRVDYGNGELIGEPVFASDEEAQTIAGRVAEGHITDFSITADTIETLVIPRGQSYTTKRGEVIDGPALIHTRWQPLNASICTTGADQNSTVLRSYTDLKRKVKRMDEALLSQVTAMGLPEGVTDEGQVIAWLIGKVTPTDAVADDVSDVVENQDDGESTDEETPVDDVERADDEEKDVERQDDDEKKIEKSVKRALLADQKRRTEIQAACKLARVDRAFADSLCDSHVDIHEARKRIIKRMATKPLGKLADSVRVTQSSEDKLHSAMLNGIVQRSYSRAGVRQSDASSKPSEFANLELHRMAEVMLRHRGAPVERMSRNEIAQAAMNNDRVLRKYRIERDTYHTTGSFPNLLLDAANKTLLAAYEEAPSTWNLWARQAPSVADFKNINRIRFSESPDPEVVPERHEYKEKAMSDSKESYTIDKYGAMFTVSWETIVNDDLDAISRIPAMHGNACRRKVNKVVYSVLTANPLMGDGIALFGAHASGTNLAGSTGAPAVTTLNAGFKAMATQKGLTSDTIVGATPKFLIVPWALSATADTLVTSMTPPDVGGSAVGTSGTNNIYGPNGKRKLTVIEEPLLDLANTSSWYLAADPSQIDTVEVAFLQGEESPVLENDWDMTTDTYRYKVRQTFGVKAIDWRGLYKNAGFVQP